MNLFFSIIGLAYCRHLSTVRTHLSALVNHKIVSPDVPVNANLGLTLAIWQKYLEDSTVSKYIFMVNHLLLLEHNEKYRLNDFLLYLF